TDEGAHHHHSVAQWRYLSRLEHLGDRLKVELAVIAPNYLSADPPPDRRHTWIMVPEHGHVRIWPELRCCAFKSFAGELVPVEIHMSSGYDAAHNLHVFT